MKRMNTVRAAGMTLLAVLFGAMAPQQAWAALGDNVRIQSIEILSEPGTYWAEPTDPAERGDPIRFRVTLADFTVPGTPRSIESVNVQNTSKLALQLNIPLPSSNNRATALINAAESTNALIFDYYPRSGDLSDYLSWRSTFTAALCPFSSISDVEVTVAGDPFGFALKAANLTFDAFSPFDYTALPAEQLTVEGLSLQLEEVEYAPDPTLLNPAFVGTFPVSISSDYIIPWSASQKASLRLWATDPAGNMLTEVAFRSATGSTSSTYANVAVSGQQMLDQLFYVTVPESLSGETIQLRFGVPGSAENACIIREINIVDDPSLATLTPDQFRANLLVRPEGRTFAQNGPGEYSTITYIGTLSTARQGIIFPAPLTQADFDNGYVPANTLFNFSDLHTLSAYFTINPGMGVDMLITPIAGAYGLTKVRIALAGLEDTYYKDVVLEILQDKITLSVIWEDPLKVPTIIERSGANSSWTYGRAMLILSQPATSTLRFNLFSYDDAVPSPTITPPAGPSKIFVIRQTPGEPDPLSGITSVTINAGSTNSPLFYVYGLDDKGSRVEGTGVGTGFIYPVKATASDSNSYDSRALSVLVENKAPIIVNASPSDGAEFPGGSVVNFTVTVEDTSLDTLYYKVNISDGTEITGSILRENRTSDREVIEFTHIFDSAGAKEYTWSVDVWDDSKAHADILSRKISITKPQTLMIQNYWSNAFDSGAGLRSNTDPAFGWVKLTNYTVPNGSISTLDVPLTTYQILRGSSQTSLFAHPYAAGEAQVAPYTFPAGYNVSATYDSFFYSWFTPDYEGIIPAVKQYSSQFVLDLKKVGQIVGAGNSNSTLAPEFLWENLVILARFVSEYQKEDNYADYNLDGLPDAWMLKYFGETDRAASVEGASKARTEVAGDYFPLQGWRDDLFSYRGGFGRNSDNNSTVNRTFAPDPNKPMTYIQKLRGRDFDGTYKTLNAEASDPVWAILMDDGTTVVQLRTTITAVDTDWRKSASGIIYDNTTGQLVAEDGSLLTADIGFVPADETVADGYVLAQQHDEVATPLLERMDPTTSDTDGDGMTDAWEYYFWYYGSRIYHAPARAPVDENNGIIYGNLWPRIDPKAKNLPTQVTYPVTRLFFNGVTYSTSIDYITYTYTIDDASGRGDELLRRWEDGSVYYEGNQPVTVNGVTTILRSGMKIVTFEDGTTDIVRRTIFDLGVNDTHPVALTAEQCPFVLGMAFNLGDPTVGIPIPARRVMVDFDPMINWTASRSVDTDDDGLTNYEEFVLGTNPIHWDSDGDGMADFWEVFFELNPNAPDADANPDMDVMAFYVDPETGEELKHDQVFERLGYNPLTGWLSNTLIFVNSMPVQSSTSGWLVNTRLPVSDLPEMETYMPATYQAVPLIFAPVNSRPFTNYDEYEALVTNIRQAVAPLSFDPGSNRYIFRNSTNPRSSDTDSDGVPDGWELYTNFSPTTGNAASFFTEGPYFTELEEFSSLLSFYECTGAFDGTGERRRLGDDRIRLVNPHWINKLLPTNPGFIFADGTYLSGLDTDSDGVIDHEEAAFPYFYGAGWGERTFLYGTVPDVVASRGTVPLNVTLSGRLGCYPGGGLNPTSMDTDLDGLPDGWEAQFAGVVNSTGTRIINGMDGTSPYDALVDNDGDGLYNYQEYLTQMLRHVRYDLGTNSAPLNAFNPVTKDGFSAVIDLLTPPLELLCRYEMGDLLVALANNTAEYKALRNKILDAQLAQYEAFLLSYLEIFEDPLLGDIRLVELIEEVDYLKLEVAAYRYELALATRALGVAQADYDEAAYEYDRALDAYNAAVERNDPNVSAYADRLRIATFWLNNAEAWLRLAQADYDDYFALANYYELSLQQAVEDRDARLLEIIAGGIAVYGEKLVAAAEGYYAILKTMETIEANQDAYLANLAQRGFNGGVVINSFEWDPAANPGNLRSPTASYYLSPIGMHQTLEMLQKNNPDHSGDWSPLDFEIQRGLDPAFYNGMFISTDPNMGDSDNDGMDDYFEVYHGLNPILGAADYAIRPEQGIDSLRASVGVDRIGAAYWGIYGPSQAAGVEKPYRNPFGNPALSSATTALAYNFYEYPWMAGLPYADPDGDGLTNAEEAVNPLPGVPGTTMTDPSPLWFTDPANPNSFVTRFYTPSGVTKADDGSFELNPYFFPKYWASAEMPYFFPFEIQEGYDTDGDGIGDEQEAGSTASAQDHESPYRRQAIHFNGAGALQNYTSFVHGPTSLRSFTVEAWVRPDRVDGDQVIVERSWLTEDADYITVPDPSTMIRRNFRLGLKDGKPYGLFTTSASVEAGASLESLQVLPTDSWTHLALRYAYDSSKEKGSFELWINGRSAVQTRSSLTPATGIISYSASLEVDTNIGTVYSYRPAPVFVGAAPLRPNEMKTMLKDVGPDATMQDVYTDFFAGYIDEVRIWNGARTDAQIIEWMKKAMPSSYVSTNRWETFLQRYTDNGHYTVLPEGSAELVALYNFDTLFTADANGRTQIEPSGMDARTLTVADDPNAEDSFYTRTVPVNLQSTVYTSNRYVTWLKNTVGHLPMMDIVTDYYYPASSAYEVLTNSTERAQLIIDYRGPTKVSNSFYWTPQSTGNTVMSNPMVIKTNPYGYTYRTTEEFDPVTYWALQANVFRSVNDLLPLGDAASLQVEMWDGSVSTILPPDDLEEPGNWTALVDPGSCLTAGQAFLDQLAQGQTADFDDDGLPDWWENYFGFDANSAEDPNGWFADPDGDGLYNYAEYRAGTNPNQYSSSGKGLPDFHTALWDTRGKPTYGFLYTDHDFMEDFWERRYYPATSVDLHDPWKDPDNDGWCNFAEARANPFGFTHSTSPDRIEAILYGDKKVPEYPEPVLPITFDYFGRKSVTNDTAAIVVNTYTTSDMNGKPDATFRIPLTTERVEKTQVLGNLRTGLVRGVLDPGHIAPGTFIVQITRYVPAHGTTDYSIEEDGTLYFHDDMGGESPNGEIGNLLGTMVGLNENGEVELYDSHYGTINYKTGEYSINLEKEFFWSSTGTSAIGNVLTASYETALPTTEFPLTFSLVKPTSGHIREGKNYITAFIDYNGDGRWNVDEPAGMTDTLTVDVGWDRVEDIHIGLTDEAPPGTVRVEFPAEILESIGTATIVIMDEYRNRELYEKTLVYPKNNIMEADIFTKTNTPYGYLPGSNNPNVKEIIYQLGYKRPDDPTVYIWDESIGDTAVTNYVDRIRTAELLSPINSQIIGTSRPTIEWTCDVQPVNINIKVTSKDTGLNIYTSGAILCPGPVKSVIRADGSSLNTYRMTLPLNAGDMNDSTGRIFCNGDYAVEVTLRGSGSADNSSVSISGSFRLDVVSSTNNTQYGEYHSGYYKAQVIYNGVLQESALSGVKLYVRAFTTASFNGPPAAAAGTTIMGSASSRDPLTGASVANVELTGLNIQATDGSAIPYYTMAFLDLNNNGLWDHWEPWGYAITGKTSSYFYDAMPSYAHRSATSDVTTFFIQDVDTDNDKLADSWEWLQAGKPKATASEHNPSFLKCLGTSSSGNQNGDCWDENGSGGCSTPSSLMLSGSLDAVDTDGDGLSDFFEQLLGTDPNVANDRIDGLTDLQAYTFFGAFAGDSFDLFIRGIRQTAPGVFEIDWNWYNRTRLEAVSHALSTPAAYELQFSPELGQNAEWKTIHSTTGSAPGGSIPVDPGTPKGFFRLKLK